VLRGFGEYEKLAVGVCGVSVCRWAFEVLSEGLQGEALVFGGTNPHPSILLLLLARSTLVQQHVLT